MNFGERLQTARKARGMTQKELGLEMHYPYNSADVRIAQYESSIRVPGDETIEELAKALEVSSHALKGPEGYSPADVMRILFEMEEQGYRVDIRRINNQVVVQIHNAKISGMLLEWRKAQNKLKMEKLSRKEYLTWKLCWEE